MSIQVMRAVETWQQAGAYYVRIQAMSRQYHITLREEFDDHDTPDAKYIVLLDNDFPVATCRLYEYGNKAMMLGRVVVLPEYRSKGLGRQAVLNAYVGFPASGIYFTWGISVPMILRVWIVMEFSIGTVYASSSTLLMPFSIFAPWRHR